MGSIKNLSIRAFVEEEINRSRVRVKSFPVKCDVNKRPFVISGYSEYSLFRYNKVETSQTKHLTQSDQSIKVL